MLSSNFEQKTFLNVKRRCKLKKLFLLSLSVVLLTGCSNESLNTANFIVDDYVKNSNKNSKADYLGDWGDLYSQRANLSISDAEDSLKVVVNWGSSVSENTEWDYDCKMSDKNNLQCTNGKRIEMSEKGNKAVNVANATVYLNKNKGSLVRAMTAIEKNGRGFFDKDDIMKNSEDMILIIRTSDGESIDQCVFNKWKH